jgi:hypothetical protein
MGKNLSNRLVVGQKVWLQSGDQFKEAAVIEVAEHSIMVEVEPSLVGDEGERRYSLQFHISRLDWLNGKQAGVFRYTSTYGGWDELDRRPLCTEFGPWELVPSIPDKP